MANASMNLRRGLAYGVLGGVIAGLVMSGLGYLIPIPKMNGVPFFINAVVMWNYLGHWGLDGVSIAIMGWALHIITSSVVGGLFGVLIARFAFFKVRSLSRGLVWGAITGVAVWVLLFLPVTIPFMSFLFFMSGFMAGSLGYNVVYGLVLGAAVGMLMARGSRAAVVGTT